MKKRLSRETKIGIYGVSMILLLYLGINYIKNQDLFSRDYTYYAVYDNSDGIESSSPVTIKGYRVGTVDKVWYDVDQDKVIVRFSVKHAYRVPAGTEARIASASFLGSKVVDLRLGESDIYMNDGDTIMSAMDPGLLGITADEVDKLKQRATTMVDQLSQALISVNTVLSEENVGNLGNLLANLSGASEDVNRIVKTDISAMSANLSTLTGVLAETAPRLTGIVEKFDDTADSIQAAVPQLVAGAMSALDELTLTIHKLSDPNGTAGKLLSDSELYDNLANASESLNLLLEDIRLHPRRYLHFSVFGGKDRD